MDSSTPSNGHSAAKSNLRVNLSTSAEDNTDASCRGQLISQNSDLVKESKSFRRLSLSQNMVLQRDSAALTSMLLLCFSCFPCLNIISLAPYLKFLLCFFNSPFTTYSFNSWPLISFLCSSLIARISSYVCTYLLNEAITDTPGTTQKVNLSTGPKAPPFSSRAVPNTTGVKRNSAKTQSTENGSIVNKEIIPVLVPRNNERTELASECRKGGVAGREIPQRLQPKVSDWKSPTTNEDLGRPTSAAQSEVEVPKAIESSSPADRNNFPSVKCSIFETAATERSVNDDTNLVSTKLDINTAHEPLSSHPIENCAYSLVSYFFYIVFTFSASMLLCVVGCF